jgi:hypothetical protein
MIRERALKVVLVVVGLLLLAVLYPMFMMSNPELQMLFCVYATLGLFLVLAARNPSAHRSLIAFAAWSSLVHAALMTEQAFRHIIQREELYGSLVLVIIAVALIALAPPKPKASVAE